MRRNVTIVVALIPVVATVIGASLLAVGSEDTHEFPCWVLPDALIASVPGVSECPLRFLEEIRWVKSSDGSTTAVRSTHDLKLAIGEAGATIQVAVLRDDARQWVSVPIHSLTAPTRAARTLAAALIAAAFMWIPVFLLRRSESPAATPLAIFYSATAVVLVTAMAGRSSEWMTRGSLLALIVAPAALAHLGMVFPMRGRAVSRAPQLVAIPYLSSSMLAGIYALSLDRSPVLWPAFVSLLLLLCMGAWGVLLLSCGFALRESRSSIERARARLVFFGTLLLPVIPTVVFARGTSAGEMVATYLWTSALAMPLPIGLAISRYNLLDLSWDARIGVARALYLVTGAVLSAALVYAALGILDPSHPLQDLGVLFSIALGCLLAVEVLREPMLGYLEGIIAPGRAQLRRLRAEYGHEITHLRDEDGVADRLTAVVTRALSAPSGCVFLRRGNAWRAASPFGPSAPSSSALVRAAEAVLGSRRLVQLTREPRSPEGSVLERAGVDLIASIGSDEESFGLILVAPRDADSPYAGVELDFLATAVAEAGIAMHNARLADELAAVERQAAMARVATDLMHDMGKDLGWIQRLLTRLEEKDGGDERSRTVVAQMRELSDSVVSRMRGFLQDASESPGSPGVLRLDQLVDRSIRRLHARGSDEDRVIQSIDPSTRNLQCHENVGRVVVNLVENGLQASQPDGIVRVASRLDEDGSLMISVSDDGCGIPKDQLEKVFEPGFTTRRTRGGTGIGLAVSRDIIQALGGEIALSPRDAGGICATMRVPGVAGQHERLAHAQG